MNFVSGFVFVVVVDQIITQVMRLPKTIHFENQFRRVKSYFIVSYICFSLLFTGKHVIIGLICSTTKKKE